MIIVKLTRCEQKVLEAIARGLPAKQIGAELGRSKRTVDFHLENLYEKLQVSSSLAAILTAVQLGLIPCPCQRSIARGAGSA